MTTTRPTTRPVAESRADSDGTASNGSVSDGAGPDRAASTAADWTLPPVRWFRPLLVSAVILAATVPVFVVLALVDPREVIGESTWIKPLKFAISISVYSATLAWMIGQLRRGRRAAEVAGWLIVGAMALEMTIITGFAAVAERSHFNNETLLHSIGYSTMGGVIALAWIMTTVIGVAAFRNPSSDGARTLAIRAGVVIGLVGMGLAMLMTIPTAEQLQGEVDVIGAHTVGLEDGGPGLPLVGWSTVGGDLRIPHFVGMHALQALPLLVIALELLSRRVSVLRDPRTRLRLMLVASAGFAAMLALLTWQALAGQSIVRPEGSILASGVLLTVLVAGAAVAVLVAGRARAEEPRPEESRPEESRPEESRPEEPPAREPRA